MPRPKRSLSKTRHPCFLACRIADHKARSVVWQDGCSEGTEHQNCLPEHLYGIQAGCFFEHAVSDKHREASSRYAIRLRSLTQKSFMTCQFVCHMASEYCRPNLTHLRFYFCLCRTRFCQPVFCHYVVYDTDACVFLRQCLGELFRPQTASLALCQHHLDFLIRYGLGCRSASTADRQ